MFIAGAQAQGSRSVRSETRQQNLAGLCKSGCAPTERRVKQSTADYKHLAPNGAKSINVLLYFKLESTNDKWKMYLGRSDDYYLPDVARVRRRSISELLEISGFSMKLSSLIM
jgi:hypothetical protein